MAENVVAKRCVFLAAKLVTLGTSLSVQVGPSSKFFFLPLDILVPVMIYGMIPTYRFYRLTSINLRTELAVEPLSTASARASFKFSGTS
jgi:hypothetical protein